ncbi:MAG: serine hydrolase [Planctomycetota bacterium]|jgi:CubicO group peptidase (beta-lactamase class C family)/D-alanyl-D-alanine dipeptidase
MPAIPRLIALLLAGLFHPELAAQELDFAPLQRAIEKEMEQQELPAVSIAILAGDKIVWSQGFGHADTEGKNPVSGASVYRVASVSKLFTATAVMQLVEQGRLDLDAPLSEIIPDFEPANQFDRPITLRQILSHHSGLLREPAEGHYFAAGNSLTELVHSLNGEPLVYAPASKFKYSNAAVSVAGYAVERVSGKSFAEYAQAAILEPLGMSGSSFAHGSSAARNAVAGSMWTLDGRRFPAPTFELGMLPAANLYASMEDLLRFARGCFLGEHRGETAVLEEGSLRAMYRPQFDSDFIGLGFFLDEFQGERRVGHNGAVYGHATQLFVLPDKGIAVACAVSLDFANGSAERLANRALELMLATEAGRAAPVWPALNMVGGSAARDLAGRYGDAEFWIELRERAGRLVEIPSFGLPASYWRSREDYVFHSQDKFRAETGALELRPVEGGVRRNGRFLPRIDAEPAPAAERFLPLIGEYGWDHDVLYIFEDAGKLCCLIEWFARYPLIEIGPDHYRMPDRGMYPGEELRFERDDSGAVQALRVGAVRFPRRPVGVGAGATFKIEPLHPPERLRELAAAGAAPKEEGEFRAPELVDLSEALEGLQLDIRYASTNNFMGLQFYPRAVAMLQRPAAEALARAQAILAESGYGLLIHDAYRPWSVTKMFWDATPQDMKDFVADPSQGSRHNRGCAVDLTLFRLDSGAAVEMVSGYDEFTARAFPNYPGGTWSQRWHRELLRKAMESAGFSVYTWEWWHFDFRDWRSYPILDQPIR